MAKDLAEEREEVVGVVAEAEVGEVDAVDGAVVLDAVHVFRREVVEVVGVFFFEAEVVFVESLVLFRKIGAEIGVVAREGYIGPSTITMGTSGRAVRRILTKS